MRERCCRHPKEEDVKVPKIAFILVCFAGLGLLVWAQKTRAVPHQERAVEQPETTTTVTGELVVNITVNVTDPAITSSTVVGCEVEAGETGDTFGTHDEIITAATSGSGKTRTATLDLNYSWMLNTPTKDTVTLSYICGFPTGAAANTLTWPARASKTGDRVIVGVPSGRTEEMVDITL
jgi:hypothetical protein